MKILIEIKVEDMAKMIKVDTEENYMEIVQRNAKDMITYYGERNIVYGVNNFYSYTAYELKEKYQNYSLSKLYDTPEAKGKILFGEKDVPLLEGEEFIQVAEGGNAIILSNGKQVSAQMNTNIAAPANVVFNMVGTIETPIGNLIANQGNSDFSYWEDDFLEQFLQSNWGKFIEFVLGGGSFNSKIEYYYSIIDPNSGKELGRVYGEDNINIINDMLDK